MIGLRASARAGEFIGPVLAADLGAEALHSKTGRDAIETLWLTPEQLLPALRFLKTRLERPFRMLFDLTAIDERNRTAQKDQPAADFTAVYQLFSFDRNRYLRLKVPLEGPAPHLPSATAVWPAADWYEREVYDLFGLTFDAHPDLRRILMPPTWQGHPLRKDHPARATELPPFRLSDEQVETEQEALRADLGGFDDEHDADAETLVLNLGPQHPGTHGVIRFLLKLDGERIRDARVEIGYHHRGAEKMAERQTWHTFIPYTDRIDYLGGVMNNMAYLLAVEQLAGIAVPPRAQVIRVMLAELFRIASHLVWYGTFAQDVGQMSPVFYMFTDRERLFGIVEAITGGRMHPSWFRLGGVAADLPHGWHRLVEDFLDYLPARLDEYDSLVMKNRILKARTVGVGETTTDEAIDWGMTGPGLRATGLGFDLRKRLPYSGYEAFEFEVPTGRRGDAYDRARVRVAEMRESLRIVRQCLAHMPGGPVKSEHPIATPPSRERMLEDIETLIGHFLSVAWGPVIPAGEAFHAIEATKGANGYYLISDGGTGAYRARIRTPSFPHIQMVPKLARGLLLPDLLAILGSIDFVLADVDR